MSTVPPSRPQLPSVSADVRVPFHSILSLPKKIFWRMAGGFQPMVVTVSPVGSTLASTLLKVHADGCFSEPPLMVI